MPGFGFDTIEELRGKSPDQVREELQAGKKALQELGELRTQFGEMKDSVAAIPTAMNSVVDKLAALELGISEVKQQPRQQNQQQQEQQRQPQMRDIVDDQEGYFEDRFNARIRPLVGAMLTNQSASARRDGLQMIKENPTLNTVWIKLQSECETMFKTLAPQQAIQPDMYVNCVEMVLGKNFQRLASMVNKDNGTLDLESSNATQTSQTSEVTYKLTQDEQEIAKRFGMTDKEYGDYKMGKVA